MAAVELILLQRVENLGQMGEVVKVKPGYARNFLLPEKKALRATKANLARFEQQRAQLEAQNLKRREEAERVAERVAGLSVVIIRQAGESGSLYGSVSGRDVAEATTEAGLTITRQQVVLDQPIKTLGLTQVRVVLHPEVASRSPSTSPAAGGGRTPGPRRSGRRGGRGRGRAAKRKSLAEAALFEGESARSSRRSDPKQRQTPLPV